MKIYVSTGLNKSLSSIDFANKIIKNKINCIEFSSGKYDRQILKKIKNLEADTQIHNYFPTPKKPFVVNLASNNKAIFNQSLFHLKKAINFSKKINAKFFSFHAGFLVDPDVRDFGKSLSGKITTNRDQCLETFIKRVKYLSKYSKKRKIQLLLENNVLTKKISKKFDQNPFLMSNYSDTKKIMNSCLDVGLLVDVGHLKVSSKTLNFSAENYLRKFNKFIKAYHLSDNNGLSDENNNLKKNSWFWKYLKKDVAYCTLELKNLKMSNLKEQIKLVNEKFNSF